MDQAIRSYENLFCTDSEHPDQYAWPYNHTPWNSQPPGSSQLPQSDTIFSSIGMFEPLGRMPQGDFGMHSENNVTPHQVFFDLDESIQHGYMRAETSDGLTDTVASQGSSLNPMQSIGQERARKKKKRNSPSPNILSPVQASKGTYRCQHPGCNASGFNRKGLLQ